LRIDAACFGVAGPVVDGRSVTTNLPWQIDEATLRARIPARRVRLLNDLEATGYGVLTLPPAALVPLQPGTRRRGTVALIAAGTGLGRRSSSGTASATSWSPPRAGTPISRPAPTSRWSCSASSARSSAA